MSARRREGAAWSGVDLSGRRRGEGSRRGARILEHARDQRRRAQALRRGRRAPGIHPVSHRSSALTRADLPLLQSCLMLRGAGALLLGRRHGTWTKRGSQWVRDVSPNGLSPSPRPTRKRAPTLRSPSPLAPKIYSRQAASSQPKREKRGSWCRRKSTRPSKAFRRPGGLGRLLHQGRVRRRADASRRFCRLAAIAEAAAAPARRKVRANARRLTGAKAWP